MTEKNDILDELTQLIVDGNDEKITETTKKALDIGIDPYTIIDVLDEGMRIVSKRYDNREIALPELILAGDAFQASMNIIKPKIKERSDKKVGRLVIGTVQYDIHTLGHELVKTMMEVEGFECWDLGGDVSKEMFIDKVKEVNADLLGLSALMTTTMLGQKDVIDALKDADIRDRVKVMVGGAPVSQEWADKIGADGYGKDAIDAVKIAKKLLNMK